MQTFKEFLNEMPLYHDKELNTKSKLKHELNDKSMDNLKAEYKLFGSTDDFQIWFNGKTFLVGYEYTSLEYGELFSIGMMIRTRGNTMFPTTPADVNPGKNTFQVSWAEISDDFVGLGKAKKIYLKIIEKVGSLTSDNRKFL